MNVLRLLLVSSILASLSACSLESASPTPTPTPAPTTPPTTTPPPDGSPPPGTSDLTATWKGALDHTLSNLVMASAGSEVAVAYSDWDAQDDKGLVRTTLQLRRLGPTGVVTQGSSVELGKVESTAPAKLTLATDGSQYLACWEDGSQIACGLLGAGKGAVQPALSVVGDSPSLAHDAKGFALAYRTPGHVGLVRVASDGSAEGKPTLFDAPPETVGYEAANFLTASDHGFLLVSGAEKMTARPLDSAFAPTKAPLDLGVSYWFHGVIAASGGRVAVSLSKPYGGNLFLFEGGALTSSQEVVGGGKTGIANALTADGSSGSFTMIAADDSEGGFDFSSIVGGQVIAREQNQEQNRYDEGSVALLPVPGGLLFAATAGVPNQEIIVARLARP